MNRADRWFELYIKFWLVVFVITLIYMVNKN